MQKRIAKMQALGQKVTVYNIKMHYSLTCSAETIKERVFKAMGQKWLAATSPGYLRAARRTAGGVFQVSMS